MSACPHCRTEHSVAMQLVCKGIEERIQAAVKAECERVLSLVDDALLRSRKWGAQGTHDIVAATVQRIREEAGNG